MSAIASLEDLKSAQKDLCYSMRVCLKRPARRSGFAQAGAILERSDHLEMAQDRLEECVWSLHGKGSRHSKAEWEATSRPTANGFLCRGKLWLQERTPEQLKGEAV